MPQAASEMMYCRARESLIMTLRVRQAYSSLLVTKETQRTDITHPLTGQEYPVVRFQQNLDDELLGER
jgi:hypothetical protein